MNNDAKYWEVANEALAIAKQIGTRIMEEGYYSDKRIGKQYKFSGLNISYYDYDDNDFIYIYLNEIKVLFCGFTSRNLEYIDGKWAELIHKIYEQIPSILEERKNEEEFQKQKVFNLKSLEKYFNYLIILDEKEGFLDNFNKKIGDYGLSVKKNVYYPLIKNNVTGDYEESAVQKNTFYIEYLKNKVAEFNGNSFNPLPNVNELAKEFVPGIWENVFKNFISMARDEEDERMRNALDNSAEEIIRKFNKR